MNLTTFEQGGTHTNLQISIKGLELHTQQNVAIKWGKAANIPHDIFVHLCIISTCYLCTCIKTSHLIVSFVSFLFRLR